MAPYRRRRFGSQRTPRTAIKETSGVQTGRGSTCQGCRRKIVAGEAYVRYQLAKRYRTPCTTCGVTPMRAKRFHEACRPIDVNKAMNFDPNRAGTVPHAAPTPTPSAPPPPKPPSAKEAAEAALLSFEVALKRRLAENPSLVKSEELEKTLKTYQGCKGRALRGSTDAEAAVGLKMALKRALDLVF